MAEIEDPDQSIGMNERIGAALRPMFGLACCRLRVGRFRSLSIGFGAERPHGKTDTQDSFYGEWEITLFAGAVSPYSTA